VADLAAAPTEKPKLKKKERKSAQAAAADSFPAESLAVAGQANAPVAETATATELKQALAPEGAPELVFPSWLHFMACQIWQSQDSFLTELALQELVMQELVLQELVKQELVKQELVKQDLVKQGLVRQSQQLRPNLPK